MWCYCKILRIFEIKKVLNRIILQIINQNRELLKIKEENCNI